MAYSHKKLVVPKIDMQDNLHRQNNLDFIRVLAALCVILLVSTHLQVSVNLQFSIFIASVMMRLVKVLRHWWGLK